VGYPSEMRFKEQSPSGSQVICDVFAESLERTYAVDSWFQSSPRPDLVNGEPLFGSLQFTVIDVKNALLELDSSKSPDPNVLPHSHCIIACSSIGHWQRVSSPIHDHNSLTCLEALYLIVLPLSLI
jgi:hypothetical protein